MKNHSKYIFQIMRNVVKFEYSAVLWVKVHIYVQQQYLTCERILKPYSKAEHSNKQTNTKGMIYDLIKLVVFIVFICLGNRMAVFCKCTVANFKQWSYIQCAPSRAIIIQLCFKLILMWRSHSDVYICTLYSSKCLKLMRFLKALVTLHV